MSDDATGSGLGSLGGASSAPASGGASGAGAAGGATAPAVNGGASVFGRLVRGALPEHDHLLPTTGGELAAYLRTDWADAHLTPGGDPHPGYATDADLAGVAGAVYTRGEADARFEPLDSAYTKPESDARYLAADYVPPPPVIPPEYLTESEGDLRYAPYGAGADGITQADADVRYVNTAGDTMTGALTIAPAAGQSALIVSGGTSQYLSVSGLASERMLQIANWNGLPRWRFGSPAAAETGSNVGSDLQISRWDDAGSVLGTALSITRATGAATFGGAVTTTGIATIYGGASLFAPSTSATALRLIPADDVNGNTIVAGLLNTAQSAWQWQLQKNGTTLQNGEAYVAGKAVASSPDASNALEWRANGFYVTPKITVAASAPGSPATGDLWIW